MEEGEGGCASPFPESAAPLSSACTEALLHCSVHRILDACSLSLSPWVHHHPLNHRHSPDLSLQLPQSLLHPQPVGLLWCPSDGSFPLSRPPKNSHCPFNQIRPSRETRPKGGHFWGSTSPGAGSILAQGFCPCCLSLWTALSYPSLAGPLIPPATAPRPWPLKAPLLGLIFPARVLQRTYPCLTSAQFLFTCLSVSQLGGRPMRQEPSPSCRCIPAPSIELGAQYTPSG